jgi:ferredoxin-NADP reductase
MLDARVTAARTLSDSVREVSLAPEAPFEFVPGQWVSIRVPGPRLGAGAAEPGPARAGEDNPDSDPSRAYSIASAPRPDGSFEIAVTRVPGGRLSRWLHEVQPGERVQLSRAQGFFTLVEPVRPILMVATGSGVSPLRSMLLARAGAGSALPRTTLLFGVRTERDILYRADFEALEARLAAFRFVPTLSRPAHGWTGCRGWVQAHVVELVRALGGECDAYACGLNRMIREVRAVLKGQLGFARARIHTERYD